MDPATTGLILSGGLGLLGGKNQKSAADKAADVQREGIALQKPLIDMLVRAGNAGWDAFSKADAGGAFDPTKDREVILNEFDALAKRQTENTAAQARINGYRPGDSVPRQTHLLERNALEKETANRLTGLRRQLLREKLAALAATNPQLAGQAAGLIGQNQANLAGLVGRTGDGSDPTSLLTAILPLLNKQKQSQSFGQLSGVDLNNTDYNHVNDYNA